MNRKPFSCIAAIVLACSCSGCAASEESSEQPENQVHFSDGFTLPEFDTRMADAHSLYPDKTVLVWACDEPIRYESALNAYLNDHDYPFVIVFRNYTPEDETLYAEDGSFRTSYAENLLSALAAGDQIDIVSTGYRFAQRDTFSNPYYYFVDHDVFLPIENMLSLTEAGRTFYENTPENYWNSLLYQGHIYGVDGYLSGLHDIACLQVNTDLVPENVCASLTNESYVSLLSQLQDLAVAQADENTPPYQIAPHYLEDLSTLTDYDFLWNNIYIDETGTARNIYESAEIAELFALLSEGYHAGTIVRNPKRIEQTLADFSCTRAGDYVQNRVTVDAYFGISAMNGTASGYRIYPDITKTVHPAQNAAGICSQSQNPALAMEALAVCLCTEECNDLLCFGPDYALQSGCIVPDGFYNIWIVENRFAHHPFYDLFHKDIRPAYKAAFESCTPSPYIGFSFDTSKIADELLAVERLVSVVSDEFPHSDYPSGEAYLASLNEKLYEAGLQTILDEANRQLSDFRKSNS